MAVVDLEDVAARRAVDVDAEAHALLDDADLVRLHRHPAEFRANEQTALLRHCRHQRKEKRVNNFEFE